MSMSALDYLLQSLICICSAKSENRYSSGIVLRKVGILALSGEVGILTLRIAIPELLVRKVGIGTQWEYVWLH